MPQKTQPSEIDPNGNVLTTISAKVPRYVEDIFIKVAAEADLDESRAYRIVLTSLARYLAAHWRRGPTLSAFLEYVEFDVERYNAEFVRRKVNDRNYRKDGTIWPERSEGPGPNR